MTSLKKFYKIKKFKIKIISVEKFLYAYCSFQSHAIERVSIPYNISSSMLTTFTHHLMIIL